VPTFLSESDGQLNRYRSVVTYNSSTHSNCDYQWKFYNWVYQCNAL